MQLLVSVVHSTGNINEINVSINGNINFPGSDRTFKVPQNEIKKINLGKKEVKTSELICFSYWFLTLKHYSAYSVELKNWTPKTKYLENTFF